MDDYFNPGLTAVLLVAATVLQNALSNFRLSFDLLSDNVNLDEIGDRHQLKIEKLLYSRDRILVTLTYSLILLSTLTVLLVFLLCFGLIGGFWGAAAASLVGSVLLLAVTTYIIPAAAAKKAKFKVILSYAPVVRVFYWILYPFVIFSAKLQPDSFRKNGSDEENPISLEELSEAVEIVSKSSSPNDKKILTGLGWFVDAKVSDIMTHRTEMVAMGIDSTFKEIEEAFISSKYSRIPIYQGNIDTIEGVLYVKDIIEHIHEPNYEWQKLIRKPTFIEDNAYAKDLLTRFQECRGHLAVVVDEYGSTQGVVTMEDILEEIVGEIDDEADTDEEADYLKIDDRTYIFEGKISVNDFEHILDIDEEEIGAVQGEADTLAGLFIELYQDFPHIGAEVEAIGYRFIVTGMSKNRITKIKVSRTDD